jgi:hypothetical protein
MGIVLGDQPAKRIADLGPPVRDREVGGDVLDRGVGLPRATHVVYRRREGSGAGEGEPETTRCTRDDDEISDRARLGERSLQFIDAKHCRDNQVVAFPLSASRPRRCLDGVIVDLGDREARVRIAVTIP